METHIEIYDLDGKLLEKDKISDYGYHPNNQMILQIEECLYYLKFECKKVNEHTNCIKVMKFKLDTMELSIHLISYYNPDSSSGDDYINYTTQSTRQPCVNDKDKAWAFTKFKMYSWIEFYPQNKTTPIEERWFLIKQGWYTSFRRVRDLNECKGIVKFIKNDDIFIASAMIK